MIKADIINRVAAHAKITKVKAVEAVEAVFEAMKGAMQRGERIELRGFGVFQGLQLISGDKTRVQGGTRHVLRGSFGDGACASGGVDFAPHRSRGQNFDQGRFQCS